MKRFLSIVGLVLLLLIGFGFYMLVFAPNTPSYTGKKSIIIFPGASIDSVASALYQEGILQSPTTFVWLAKLTGWEKQLKVGHYLLPSGLSNREILDKLRKGLQDPVRVTIPAGTRPTRLAALLGRQLQADSLAFLQLFRDSTFAAQLHTDTLHLFGYMLPDTYFFYWTASPEHILRRIKATFDDFFTPQMQARADSLGLTKEEVIRLASIVEWETPLDEEKPRVAGVYLNRLRTGMRLQADPTVQFALMQLEGGAMRRLLYKDYRIRHPYNTYLYRGLPPGPITNPDRASILAVLYPESHNYFFFVATGEGGHTFSKTFAEHRRKARAYQRYLRAKRAEAARTQATLSNQ